MKITLNPQQFKNAITSAGLWFVAMYMEAFILRLDELHDKDKKQALIQEIYNNGGNADDDIGGTRTRVNALLRIIDSNRIVEALEKAATSSRLGNDFPEAVSTANELLGRIHEGKISIPK